jgi:hypothetical protein
MANGGPQVIMIAKLVACMSTAKLAEVGGALYVAGGSVSLRNDIFSGKFIQSGNGTAWM